MLSGISTHGILLQDPIIDYEEETVRPFIMRTWWPRDLFTLAFTMLTMPLVAPAAETRATAHGTGAITGTVLIPADLDVTASPPEAKLFIYLSDYTSKDGHAVMPWAAPIVQVIDHPIAALATVGTRHVPFEFTQLPPGTYGVSVLFDTGKPHVPITFLERCRARFLIAHPGDYAGGTEQEIHLGAGQVETVSIDKGMFVTVPEGYQSPVYDHEEGCQ